jgi:hypothetical protein
VPGGGGAPLAVAPGAALPWWRKHCPPPPIDNAQLIASSGAVPTSEPTSRPATPEAKKLAASVLSQDEKKGQRK